MRRFLVAVAAAALLLTPSPQEACAATPGALLASIRQARGDRIPTAPALMAEAQDRAREISAEFSHAGAGHPYAEILAWNAYPEEYTEGAAVAAWLDSPGHRSILLGNWTHVGVGVVDSGVKHYYVALFTKAAGVPHVVVPPRGVPDRLPSTDTETCA